nr:MAG TPA: cobalamin biosynthesis protein [Caudoviricetes sp.]
MLQMAAEKRLLKGVYMSIRVLFICHGTPVL